MARLGRGIPIGAKFSRGPVAPGLLIETLTDNFDDNVVDTTKWPGNFGTTSETGGRARVACDTGYSAYLSSTIYGLPGSFVVVKIYAPAASTATEAFGELLIRSDQAPGGTQLSWRADAATGLLTASVHVGFVDAGAATAAFDPSQPIWVRIDCRTPESLVFAYSLTGFSFDWTTLRTAATPDWVGAAAVGACLQGHRDAGTNDVVEFDNFGLVPADPIPAPAPIVIKAQRYRAKPPGARFYRAPDLRLPPSNKVAVGLDGSLGIPLSVRLSNDKADVLLVAEVRDLSFRSVIPGGYASATVSLDRPLSEAARDIALYTKLRIYDTRSGDICFEGRVEDPGRAVSNDGQIWQVTAVGPSAHAKDETFGAIWVDTSMGHFEKFGGSLASSSVSVTPNASDVDGVKVQFGGGVTVPTDAYVAARSLRVQAAGLELARVSYAVNGGAVAALWDMQSYIYPSQTLLYSDSLTTSNLTGRSGTITDGDWDPGDYLLQVRMERNGAPTAPDDNAWSHFHSIVVMCTRVTEEGIAVDDYPNDYVLASEVVQDLVGSHLPQYDGLDAFIEDTTFQITQLAYDHTTAYDVLQDLMQLDGAYYWAAWESLPNGRFRFEWRPWPQTVRWEADVFDGFTSPGSASDLYNSVRVSWKDSAGRSRMTRVTSTVADLDDAGLDRDAEIDLGQETGTAAAATSAGQAYLAEHSLPTNKGTLTIARPILDFDTGRMVDPWQIRPGGLIRVRGVHAHADALNATARDGATVFRIVAVSFSANDGTAQLELDADAISTTRAIAALQQRQARGRR